MKMMFKRGLMFGTGIVAALLLTTIVYAVASYPSTVTSFPTRVNGQTIDASWFNGLQDEVVAIEGGLLNGLAHTLKAATDNTYDLGASGAKFRDLNLGRNAVIGGTVSVSGGTGTAGQVLTSQGASAPIWSAGVPSGMAFLNTAYTSGATCPTGYTEVTALRGYYPVGLVSGGTPGTAVGTPLTDQENRPAGQHTHAITVTDTRTWRVNDGGAAGGDDVSAQTALGASPNTFTTGPKVGVSGGSISGSAANNAGSVAGTNAPYKQYPWCQKN
jgi:hypothetical protein